MRKIAYSFLVKFLIPETTELYLVENKKCEKKTAEKIVIISLQLEEVKTDKNFPKSHKTCKKNYLCISMNSIVCTKKFAFNRSVLFRFDKN